MGQFDGLYREERVQKTQNIGAFQTFPETPDRPGANCGQFEGSK
ncbi:MAG: hypothetical protein ACLFWL_01375 [Candidatus Brocadiia bacterium]